MTKFFVFLLFAFSFQSVSASELASGIYLNSDGSGQYRIFLNDETSSFKKSQVKLVVNLDGVSFLTSEKLRCSFFADQASSALWNSEFTINKSITSNTEALFDFEISPTDSNDNAITLKEFINSIMPVGLPAFSEENPQYSVNMECKIKIQQTTNSSSSNSDGDSSDDESDDNNSSSGIVNAFNTEVKEVEQSLSTISIIFNLDNNPPEKPSFSLIETGKRKIILNWDQVSDAESSVYFTDSKGIDKYEVCIIKEASEITNQEFCDSLSSGNLREALNISTCDSAALWTNAGDGTVKSYSNSKMAFEEGFENNLALYLKAYDLAGNSSVSDPTCSYLKPVKDFYQALVEAGAKTDGGFCFIATYAFKDYDHYAVRILRNFRDKILSKSDLGKSFIKFYYENGYAFAESMRDVPGALFLSKLVISFILVPLALIMLLGFNLPIQAFIIGTGLFLLARKFSLKRNSLAALLVVFSLLGTTALEARRSSNFLAEFKVGMFSPTSLDDGLGSSDFPAKPYETIFGTDDKNLPMLELDYFLFNDYGTVFVGGSIGFWQKVGKGIEKITASGVEGVPPEIVKSIDTTVFTVIPMTLHVGYKLDYFEDEFPLLPTFKVGLIDYYYYITDGSDEVSNFKGEKGQGDSGGYFYSIGVNFLLDYFDERSAFAFKQEYGVESSYLFFEYVTSKTGIFDDNNLNFSSSYWLAGFSIEL